MDPRAHDRSTGPVAPVYAFGPFRLFPAQQLLLDGDKPVRLGSRALELLVALIEKAGSIVENQELIARAWPATFVGENNLRMQIAAVRRALGDGQTGSMYIVNAPGRGYRFVAPVSVATAHSPELAAAGETDNLPARLVRVIGRSDIVDKVAAQLPRQRIISLVGAGGIGKTTVALEVARALSASYRDSVRFVDLAPLSDASLVPSALASALELGVVSEDPMPGLITFLRGRQMLIVLDNCEHVIDAAAALVEAVFDSGAAEVHVLATSREPLRARGEFVQRLPSLQAPATSAGIAPADALVFPAVQLFVERAVETNQDFELTEQNASFVAEICCRLDGNALAIELAAACVDAFGVQELSALLNDRFRLLTHGRRTALPRHQTLAAALDWSYELLPESERRVFRRLAVFAGLFTLEAAQAVAASADTEADRFGDRISSLVAKSLITADVSGPVAVYRLLETTRAYGLGKLKEADELFQFARAHASYFLSWLDCAGADLDTNPEWPTTNGRQIDNVRTALDWAFSPGGDTELGVALTIAAAPLFIILSLVEECRSRAQLAFASLAPEARTDTREAMQLFAALGATMRYTRGSGAEIEAMWSKSLAIAERRGDIDYVLRALYGLCVIGLNNGRYHDALQLAYRFKAAAGNATDPNDVLVGDRMIGLALHNLGEQAQARRHIENLLGHYATGVHRSHIVRFGYDQRARAYNTHAVILWLQGLPDAAMRVVAESIAYIQAGHHELTLCNTLSHCACPVALFAGDLAAAQRYVGMLLDHSSTQGLAVWHAAGRCFDGVLRIKQGNVRDGVQALSAGIEALSEKRFAVRYLTFLAELADAYAQLGEMAQAQATVDEAVARCERNQELWYWPELLRVKGEVQLRAATLDPEAAEALFLKSLEFARRQASLAWELRAATSLAKLWSSLGRRDEARDRLQKVYGRFAEGFETSDLKAARRILDELSIGGS